ncbi:MAG TPA: PAS domain S-box protein [Desulfomonilaceae bacterium]|nr:PAS domain S-box protein [Desulfomonilaceae bacterium]
MSDSEFTSVYDMSMEQLERRLQEIERNRIEFFDEARDGFYISTREGQFMDCNNALVRMLGYRITEEVLSLDLNKDLWANPDDRAVFQSIIEKWGSVLDYEAKFKRSDGEIIYVSLSAYVWRDSHGKIGGYRGFVVNRTERKLLDDLLSASELKYKGLFNKIREGVFISDAAGRVVDCNQALCDIIGRTREEFYGMDYYKELFAKTDNVADFRRKFTKYGEIGDYELQIVRKDGTVRDVSMSGYATRNAAGEIVSYQGLVRDITAAKRLGRQRVIAERLSATGEMASHLAYELTNPVYGITDCLERLKDVVPQAHDARKYFEAAYCGCKRIAGILIKMKDFFKPVDGLKSAVDINKLLEEILLSFEAQFRDLNIRISTDLAPDLPHMMAVGSRLRQAFINMILNADQAMPNGGELRIASRFDQEKNCIILTVEDTGVGIPPQNLEKIFDVSFTRKENETSIGLGLSICFAVIREHEGRIDVTSKVGKGTVFQICLPVQSLP